jgi:hypothetical protein
MRELLALGYVFLTMIICVQAMLSTSFRIGAEALAACVLNFAGMAIIFACFLIGREKGYRKVYLYGAGAIALVLVAAGFALMIRTGFRVPIYDASIPGPVWLLLGSLAALLWSLHRRARARARSLS